MSKVQDIEARQDVPQTWSDRRLNLTELEYQLLSELATISSTMRGLECLIPMIMRARDISVSQSDECLNSSDRSLSKLSSVVTRRHIKQKIVSVTSPFYVPTPFGSIIVQVQTEATGTEDVAQHCIQLPQQTLSLIWHPVSWAIRWGLAFGIQMSIMRSHIGWKYVLSQIRSVSNDSLVFNFCRDGNINAVRELISRGDASVLDTDSWGRQPLHVSISTLLLT